MGKRFVTTHAADKRAIRLCIAVRKIEQEFPRLVVQFSKDDKIIVAESDEPINFNIVSVDRFLLFDLERAKREGGTRSALMTSERKIQRRIPQVVVDDAVSDFLDE